MKQCFPAEGVKISGLVSKFGLIGSRECAFKWAVSHNELFRIIIIRWGGSKCYNIILILNRWVYFWVKWALRFETFVNLWAFSLRSISVGHLSYIHTFRYFSNRIIFNSGCFIRLVSHLVIVHCLLFRQPSLINTRFCIKPIFIQISLFIKLWINISCF